MTKDTSQTPLFLSEEDLQRDTRKQELIPQSVFQETLVAIWNVLRQITEERKCWRVRRQLLNVLDTNILSFHRGWRSGHDDFLHHIIQL